MAGARFTSIRRLDSHGKRRIAEIGAGDFLQNVTCLWSGQNQHTDGIGNVVETDRAIIRHMFPDPVMIQPLCRAGGDKIETVIRFTLDGKFRMHTAAFSQRMAQRTRPTLRGSLLATR